MIVRRRSITIIKRRGRRVMMRSWRRSSLGEGG